MNTQSDIEDIEDIVELSIVVFGPSTYRETTRGLIFLRHGSSIGCCIGYSTGKSAINSTIKPLTKQLIKICQQYNIRYS